MDYSGSYSFPPLLDTSRESYFKAETLVLFSLPVSAIITQNGIKTPPAEFGSNSNIKFKKYHFPSLCNIAH